jgi:hypothetical protein
VTSGEVLSKWPSVSADAGIGGVVERLTSTDGTSVPPPVLVSGTVLTLLLVLAFILEGAGW